MATGDLHDELLLGSLFRFFSNTNNIKQVIRLLSSETNVTRSLLDWFVTNYTKDHVVEYIFRGRLINVSTEYKAQLNRYKKRRSDPFCRGREKFTLKTGVEECPVVETSIRQLCFLRWAVECNVLEYVEDHFDDLRPFYEKRSRKSQRKRSAQKTNSAATCPKMHKKTSSLGGDDEIKLDQHITVTFYSEPFRVRF